MFSILNEGKECVLCNADLTYYYIYFITARGFTITEGGDIDVHRSMKVDVNNGPVPLSNETLSTTDNVIYPVLSHRHMLVHIYIRWLCLIYMMLCITIVVFLYVYLYYRGH